MVHVVLGLCHGLLGLCSLLTTTATEGIQSAASFAVPTFSSACLVFTKKHSLAVCAVTVEVKTVFATFLG